MTTDAADAWNSPEHRRVEPPLSIRLVRSDDDGDLAALSRACPDGGVISFSREERVPLARWAASSDGALVVAELQGVAGVVGSARVSVGRCRFQGRVSDYALLSSLMVHPDHRRRGVARALTEWRLHHAQQVVGSHGVVLANIQAGNSASLANARRWAGQVTGRVVTVAVPTRRRPPRPRPDLVVRPVADTDLEQFAEALTTSQEQYDFARPWNAQGLRDWLQRTPVADPVHHCWVAARRDGQLLAGVGLYDEGRLLDLRVQHMPWALGVAGRVLGVVPGDGRMRNTVVDKVWCAPGQVDAARYLWQVCRWQWRGAASSLLATYDPRGQAAAVLHPAAWLPRTTSTTAVRADTRRDEETLIEPLS
jgi:GNAT superfamily N-acetyltransferase